MTPQQIFATALRLFALWLFATSFKYLVAIPKYASEHSYVADTGEAVGIGVAMVALAAVLWLFPMWIAHKFMPRTSFENRVNLQPLEAARVGSALIGLWLFANGALSVVWYLLAYSSLSTGDSAYSNVPANYKASFFYALIEATLGLVLMLRAGTFARLVIREARG